SISPHKNTKWINEIGKSLQEKYHIPYLFSDFKKEEGYKHSIELSKEYGLYRQDYCGCLYSKLERKNQNAEE
ncbi:MAG: epoxyqueuosine reductase QueH, partial [Anaeroplasmataceae bacterium]|nr:epoxyqueuosine reductase QueH [Anaeroplasmataceae bacterium]